VYVQVGEAVCGGVHTVVEHSTGSPS